MLNVIKSLKSIIPVFLHKSNKIGGTLKFSKILHCEHLQNAVLNGCLMF